LAGPAAHDLPSRGCSQPGAPCALRFRYAQQKQRSGSMEMFIETLIIAALVSLGIIVVCGGLG
jgi:hypothetical protein